MDGTSYLYAPVFELFWVCMCDTCPIPLFMSCWYYCVDMYHYSTSQFHSRCLELDPGNLPAHMSLAVCYTNESQQIKVVKVPVCRLPALEAELQCYHSNTHSQCEVHSIL